MTALVIAMEARREAIAVADELMILHPGAVVEAVELRGERVGLCAHVPGAWCPGDLAEVRAWLERRVPATA